MANSYYADHPYNTANNRWDRYSRPPADYADPYQSPRASGGRRANHNELIHPQDESEIEEIHREFPPGAYAPTYRSGGYQAYGGGPPPDVFYERRRMAEPRSRRARSVGGRRGDYYYPEDDYRRSRGHRSRRSHRSRRYSPSDSSLSRSPSPRPRRRKSLSEQALAAVGLGSSGRHSSRHRSYDRYDRDYRGGRSRSRRHRRGYSDSRSRSRDRGREQIEQTIKAALTAGAVEAFRARKEPGGWSGEKGKRILTTAISSGGIDKLISGNSGKHDKRNIIESTLAGLATNRLVNGPPSRSRSRGSRGLHRSGSRGVKDVAATGILAAAGKEAYDRYRSKSRGRSRHSDSPSDDEYMDSRHRGSKKRSKSASDYVSKGLAALGLEDKPRDRDGHKSRRYDDDYSDDDYSDGYGARHHRSPSRDGYARDSRDVGPLRSQSRNAMVSAHPASLRKYPGEVRKGGDHKSGSDSDSDLGSSTDEERTRKKLRRRELLTSGLAAVATIHAGHSAMESVSKRHERQRQLREGKITPEEARRQRHKNNLKDAASLGIAALGIKSAVSEWHEAAEHRAEMKSFKETCKRRARKRAEMRSGKGRARRSNSLPPNSGAYGSASGFAPRRKYINDHGYNGSDLSMPYRTGSV